VKQRGPVRKWAWRLAKSAGLLILLAILVATIAGWTAFGHRATGERRARMDRSPEWQGNKFRNPQPLRNDAWGSIAALWRTHAVTSPAAPPPTAPARRDPFAVPPPTGLRATWFGHSSVLVEIDGHRVLTDPIWSDRASPYDSLGPRRYYAPPLPLDQLPALDAIVISHDHYDHLDFRTISALKDLPTTFVVPLGVGAHLAYWGVPEAHIVELDWWERARVRGLEIVCTPARHASGRMLFDNDATLWAGFALVGPRHRVYYSGDTGLFPAMRDIGQRLGPFDLTMIEIGQYNGAWPDWHIGPEQAVRAHRLVRGKVLLPVHWGLFALAFHGWTEPIERALAAGDRAGATLLAPLPGESVEPEAPPPRRRWWPAVPWQTAEQDPIVSTQMD
jgi:L-ascorbate metabolism protein UlaG (beta-lactamase superfamily)